MLYLGVQFSPYDSVIVIIGGDGTDTAPSICISGISTDTNSRVENKVLEYYCYHSTGIKIRTDVKQHRPVLGLYTNT